MKLRLLLRRLTVSAPRMAVRSAMPWPLRWVLVALVAGFCSAIGLWAFEFGKDIAGLDQGSKQQLQQLQEQVQALRVQLALVTSERDAAQKVANTADTQRTTERVAYEKLLTQSRQLEQDKQRLQDDLGFFERLLPTGNGEAESGPAIRSVQVEKLPSGELSWQVLVLQASKKPVDFAGRLELTFSGTLGAKTWSAGLPGGSVPIEVRQYGRQSGRFALPAQVEVRSVTVRLLDGNSVRATQSVKLKL